MLYDFFFLIKEEDVIELIVNLFVLFLSEVVIFVKDFYLDFLFFKDVKIIIYIKLFKIVFIMRGVFGFGKFIIVRVI